MEINPVVQRVARAAYASWSCDYDGMEPRHWCLIEARAAARRGEILRGNVSALADAALRIWDKIMAEDCARVKAENDAREAATAAAAKAKADAEAAEAAAYDAKLAALIAASGVPAEFGPGSKYSIRGDGSLHVHCDYLHWCSDKGWLNGIVDGPCTKEVAIARAEMDRANTRALEDRIKRENEQAQLNKTRLAELEAEFGHAMVWNRGFYIQPQAGHGYWHDDVFYDPGAGGYTGDTLSAWARDALRDWPAVRDATRDAIRDRKICDEELASHNEWRAACARVPAVRVPPANHNPIGYQDFRPRPQPKSAPRRAVSQPTPPVPPVVRINDPWGALDALGLTK